MEIIAAYWWVWLATLLLSGGYAFYLQLKKVKSIKNNIENLKIGATVRTAFNDLGKMAFAGFIAMASAILLSIAVIIQIIDHYKHIQ